MTKAPPDEYNEFIGACADLLGRTGAKGFELRYSDGDDEGDTVVWMVIADFGGRMEAAGALRPDQAFFRLLELLVDGGNCQHCHRPTSILEPWAPPLPMGDMLCQYTYDQANHRFKRGCE